MSTDVCQNEITKPDQTDSKTCPSFASSLAKLDKVMKWQRITANQPMKPRVGHVLVSTKTENQHQLFMIGGGNHDGDVKELWQVTLNGSESEDVDGNTSSDWELCKESEDFSGRYEFAAVLDPAGDKIWMFGGADHEKPRNDVCCLHVEQRAFDVKSKVTTESEGSSKPSARTQGGNSCLVGIQDQHYLAVYGGGVKGEKAVTDGNLYLYNIGSGDWEKVEVTGDTPGVRQGHGLASIGSKIYLHGGMHEFTIHNDLYMLDLADLRSTKAPKWVKVRCTGDAPCERAAHSFIADKQGLIVLGGLSNDGALGDVWRLDTDSMIWKRLTSPLPSPRLDAASTLIIMEDKKILVIHGGMNTEGTLFDDFWAIRLE